MRFLHLTAIASTCFLAGAAAVRTQDSFAPHDSGFRVVCDDWATVRPSNEEIWQRAEVAHVSMATAAQKLLDTKKLTTQFDDARILSGSLVLSGKPFYSFDLVTKRKKRDSE